MNLSEQIRSTWDDEVIARRRDILDALDTLVTVKANELAKNTSVTVKNVEDAYFIVIAEQLKTLLKMFHL